MQTMLTSEQVERRRTAKAHVVDCGRCAFVVLRYGAEINEAMATRTLPEPVADKIRAQLCREGARLFDRIMGVGHA